MSSSQNHLSVDQKIHAVNEGKNGGNSHTDDTASDEQNVDETDCKNDPDNAWKYSLSDESGSCEVLFGGHGVVCESDGGRKGGWGGQKNTGSSVHGADVWNQVGFAESEGGHHDVVDGGGSADFSEDYMRQEVHSETRVMRDPMKASQKVHVLSLWKRAKDLK